MENCRSQISFWKNRDEQRTKDPVPKASNSKMKSTDDRDMTSLNFGYWQKDHAENCDHRACSGACVECYHSSRQNNFLPHYGDPHYEPERYTSSSGSDADEIQISGTTDYNFVKQRFREEIDRDLSVKPMTCKVERNVSSPVIKNSTMEATMGRNKLNKVETLRKDVFTRQQSPKETNPFLASKNNAEMKMKRKRSRANMVDNRAVDSQNPCSVCWKVSALEKPLSLEKDLSGHFENRTVSIRDGNFRVAITESEMQLQTDLSNAESFVKWKTPVAETSPLGNVPPFREFSQPAGDASDRINNWGDNIERTEMLKYHTDLSRVRISTCSSMNKGGEKDYFGTTKNERFSDENINYAKTTSQAGKIISSNCGQKSHFWRRTHLEHESEISLSHSEDLDIQRNLIKTENEDCMRMKPFCNEESHYNDQCDKRSNERAPTSRKDTGGSRRKNVQHSIRPYNESVNLLSVDRQGSSAFLNDRFQSIFKQEQKGKKNCDGVKQKSNFVEKENFKYQDLNGEQMHTTRKSRDTASNPRGNLKNHPKVPYRSSPCDSTHVFCQGRNEKPPGVKEFGSINRASLCDTNNQVTVSRKTEKERSNGVKYENARVVEGNATDLVETLSELTEKLFVPAENRSVPYRKDDHIIPKKQESQTITPSLQHLQDINPFQQDQQYIKSLHGTEMHAAQNAAVTSLKEHGNRLNQSMVTSHMMLQIFRATYKFWLKAREITLRMLESLNEKGGQTDNWQNILKKIFTIVKEGSKWALQILPFTPYAKSPVANVMTLVPTITKQAEQLFLPPESTQEIKDFPSDVGQIVQQDIQLSSDFEELALQCEKQFKETVNLFFEFQSIILRGQMADFIGDEDMDLLNFLIDWSAAGPELSPFVQQISDAYVKYHNATERGPANAQAMFCSFIDYDPSALNTMRCLDWNFTKAFQCRTPDGYLSSCWKYVQNRISDTNGNSATNISDMIIILETQKRNVIKNVSKLFERSQGSNASDY